MKPSLPGFIGLVLILFGIKFLADEYVDFDAELIRSYGFFLLGILGIFIAAPRKIVYVFSFISLLGLFYILGEYDLVPVGRPFIISAVITALGLSFYMLFLISLHKWQYIGYGTVISACGVFLGAYAYGVISDHLFTTTVGTYWPVLLIVVGSVMLIGGLLGRKENPVSSTGHGP